MVDFLSLALGAVVGAGVAAAITYLSLRASSHRAEGKGEIRAESKVALKQKTVGKAELDRARRQLRTVIFEKELLASALTRLYEAEVDGRISKEEREQLSQKYRDQIKAVEEKLGDSELLIEVGELENLRDELVNLFERKMEQLEARLTQAKVRLQQVRGVAIEVPSPAERVEKVEEPRKVEKKKPPESEVDKKVKALKEEVLDALARLEQIDIEG